MSHHPDNRPDAASHPRRWRGALLATLTTGGLLVAGAVAAAPAQAGEAPIKNGTARAIPGSRTARSFTMTMARRDA